MNTRANWRLILAIAAIFLSLGVGFTLATTNGAGSGYSGFPGAVSVPVQPVTVLVATKSGGVVAEVFGKAGDRVAKGSLLLRMETGPLSEQRLHLSSALRVTRAALQSSKELSVLPAGLRSAVIEVHPDVTAAEDRYVRAVAALDRANSSSAQAEWNLASAERTAVRERLSRSLSAAGATNDLAAMIPLLEGRIRDIDQILAESDVRATADGVIDILDLHAGDRLLPGNPAAVLVLPGEYFCEFPVPVADSAALRIGMESGGTIGPGRESIRWRIERLGLRTIPVGFRENRQVAQETQVRARFSAGDAVRGSLAVLELPRLRASQ
jgi:multidrug resistance efflux pump